MPHHCQKSRSRSGVGKRNSRSLGTRRRRGASSSSARRRRSRKTGQMGSRRRRRVYRRLFGTDSTAVDPKPDAVSVNPQPDAVLGKQRAPSAKHNPADASGNLPPPTTSTGQSTTNADKPTVGPANGFPSNGPSSAPIKSTTGWYDYVTGYFWPTTTFKSMREFVSSFMPSVTITGVPAQDPAKQKKLENSQKNLANAIMDYIRNNEYITLYIPWVLFGTAVVCLGLKAAWPKIRATYIEAEKSTKRYTASLVNSFNSDDDDDYDIPQRRSYSNKNRKSSHRFGKSKAYSSNRR